MLDIKNELEKIKENYEPQVYENLDLQNVQKIIDFLMSEKCDFIQDIFSDYLDLFLFDYNEFVAKYRNLNEQFNGEFLEKASEDMNLLEKFYE